ncbi:MAG TPA: phenylalanine 4-monooxygenase [Gemmatimonadales bacterium]|nr:phenylalanine 4-monooxygenase [Gemmatimonadales bacterium]
MPDVLSPEVSPSVPTVQNWPGYTDEEHLVWATLYGRRMPALRHTASRVFLRGVDDIGLESECIPELTVLNRRLARRTGWRAVPVAGFLPAEAFFGSLARREFPTTVTIRSAERLDYVPEPDIFHDVFGHVPLHADPVFADFLQRFGAIASAARTPEATERMARLFWFTVEFGLILEKDGVRAYGSGLISSHADAANALGPDCEHRPFDLDQVLDQPFRIDELQPVLFVVRSFDQLFEAVDRLSSGAR